MHADNPGNTGETSDAPQNRKPPVSASAIAVGAGAGYVATLVVSVAVFFVFWLSVEAADALKFDTILKLSRLMLRYPIILELIVAFYVIGAAAWGGALAGQFVPSLKFVHGILAGFGIVVLHLVLSPVVVKVLGKLFSVQVPSGMSQVNINVWSVTLWLLIVVSAGIGAARTRND